jgi:hypothetical protein
VGETTKSCANSDEKGAFLAPKGVCWVRRPIFWDESRLIGSITGPLDGQSAHNLRQSLPRGGLDKMKLNCRLALSVMLAMALVRIKEKRRERLRSLVKS